MSMDSQEGNDSTAGETDCVATKDQSFRPKTPKVVRFDSSADSHERKRSKWKSFEGVMGQLVRTILEKNSVKLTRASCYLAMKKHAVNRLELSRLRKRLQSVSEASTFDPTEFIKADNAGGPTSPEGPKFLASSISHLQLKSELTDSAERTDDSGEVTGPDSVRDRPLHGRLLQTIVSARDAQVRRLRHLRRKRREEPTRSGGFDRQVDKNRVVEDAVHQPMVSEFDSNKRTESISCAASSSETANRTVLLLARQLRETQSQLVESRREVAELKQQLKDTKDMPLGPTHYYLATVG